MYDSIDNDSIDFSCLHYNGLHFNMKGNASSIAEKCFDIWRILKMAPVKSVEPGNNFLA